MISPFKNLTLSDGCYYTIQFKGDKYPEYVLVNNDSFITLFYDSSPSIDCWHLSMDTSYEECDNMEVVLFEPMKADRIEWMNKCIDKQDDLFFDFEGNTLL